MRLKNYMSDIDLTKRILEIGPLNDPLICKNEADVYYADILSTDDVKKLYKNDVNVNNDDICTIDFVIHESYTKACMDVKKFDYIISSHVLEHMPRLIGFFQDTVNILNPHGKMYLFLPDCRYCFDHFRNPTSFSELYYIHTQGLAFAPWQVLDSAMMIPLNDPAVFATNTRLFSLLAQRKPFAAAKKIFENALAGHYRHVHYSVFTPQSFLLLLHEMTRAGVFPYKLAAFFPTPPYEFTFGAVLEACPELLDDADLSEREMRRYRREMARLADYEESLKRSLLRVKEDG